MYIEIARNFYLFICFKPRILFMTEMNLHISKEIVPEWFASDAIEAKIEFISGIKWLSGFDSLHFQNRTDLGDCSPEKNVES